MVKYRWLISQIIQRKLREFFHAKLCSMIWLVFCFENCFYLLWGFFSDQKNIFKIGAEGWEFAKYFRWLCRTIYETEYFLNLCSITKMKIGITNWDVETYINKLEKYFSSTVIHLHTVTFKSRLQNYRHTFHLWQISRCHILRLLEPFFDPLICTRSYW